ncbi:MAG: T9SS type A sorting domain-containing protein [Myroides sp.]
MFNNGSGNLSGHVRIYENKLGIWSQVGNDIDGEAAEDQSGLSVSLSSDGNTVAIGAPHNDGNGANSGHVRIYKNISGNWIKVGFDIDGKIIGEESGCSVSLSSDGKTVAIGAYRSTSLNGFYSGYLRIYDISNLLASSEFVSQNFNIYPNPTSDFLNISLENNLVLQEATIYNNLGQVVKTSTENIIDVSQLAKGLYFVEVTTNQGKETKKVVVK